MEGKGATALIIRGVNPKLKVLLTWGLARVLKGILEPIFWLAGRRGLLEVRRILFIALDNPGDVLLAAPCLTALKERFPSAQITVLAGPWSESLVATHPAVSRRIIYSAPWFRRYVSHLSYPPFRPMRDFFQCLWRLWRDRFDLTVDTRGEAWHILLAYLSGASLRVGYALWSAIHGPTAKELSPLLTHPVPYPWDRWSDWHRVDFNLRVVSALEAAPSDRSLVLPIPPSTQQWAQQLLQSAGVKADDLLIGLQPGASSEKKRWPVSRFAEVAHALQQRWGARFLLLGGSAERDVAEELRRQVETPPICAVGQTSLLQAAALVQRCHLMICNDSVFTHIASALKIPVVVLSRHPSHFYAPYHTPGVAMTHRLPCMNRERPDGCECPFPEYRCLQAVTVEEVLAAAEKLLSAGLLVHS